MKYSRRSAHYLATAGLVLTASWAAAFDIYQGPMFSTGSATPNVMLLVDTSGSMDNIIWADGFDLAVTYPDWSSQWGPNDGNVHLSDLNAGSGSGSCSSGYKQGIKGTVKKCLKLPDPVGSGNTRYDGNYLNYLFETYPTNTDLTVASSPIPHGTGDTRMKVAKAVATDLINSVTGVRFGVARYDASDTGAVISENCDDPTSAHLSDIQSAIAGYGANSNTPLAESLYEITRYFRGLSSYYNSGTFTSPIQYRCQKNFTIIITDGFPTQDTSFPNNDPADTADTARALPNWDGLAPATASTDYPLFPMHSDGFGGSAGAEGATLYLDDIAKFGFDIDMKTTGSDDDNISYNDPEFPKQNMTTYTVGFATSNQMMQDAADYSDGQYFTAKNADDLKAALEEVLLDIQNKATAAASVALNSTRLDAGLLIYQARYDSVDWSGDLQAYAVNDTDGTVGSKVWSANERIPAVGSRTIVTQKASPRGGITATWANLTTGQQNALKLVSEPTSCSTCSCTGNSSSARNCRRNCSKCNTSITGGGDTVLDYLLGTRTEEEQNGGDFRDRSTVLGDIVNSDPLFVGKPNFGYNVLPGAEGASYTTFRASSAYANRPPMVYVGANDGMLHGIDGSETGASAGVERFAYIPLTVFPKLKDLTNPSYAHKFYVNGSPQSGDAYLGGVWKTVLVGTLGAGGRGVFALDVTDPTAFGPSKVLWEKAVTGDTNINITDDADLGYTYGQASIGRMADGNWAAIVGNGYNSTNHRAVLFILNLADGTVLKKIDTGSGTAALPNGLSTPLIVDANNDKIIDYVYAGDMRGNLWKFDVTSGTASAWDVPYKSGGTNVPLFVATASDGTVQPITAKPQVTLRPDGDLMVFFGTGKYFEAQDKSVPVTPAVLPKQTFYGVRDPGVAITTGRSTLQAQSLVATVDDFGATLRVTTAAVPTATQNGWYFDLPTRGERQVSRPVLRTGRIIFTTVIPNSDACHGGGHSELMELNALTGGRLAITPFDLNGDGKFDAGDYVTVTIDGQDTEVPVSGIKLDGVAGTTGIAQGNGKEYKYLSLSPGGIEVLVGPGDIGAGRQSWRQLQ